MNTKFENFRLQNRTARRAESELPRIDFKRRVENRGLSTKQVLDLMERENPDLWEVAYVVGEWVWVQFDEQPSRDITAALSQLGFHWNKKRQLWQHPCGQNLTGSHRDPPREVSDLFPGRRQGRLNHPP
jgi:hypothetical protein